MLTAQESPLMLPCGVPRFGNVRPWARVEGSFGTFWRTMGTEITESAEQIPPKGTSLSLKGPCLALGGPGLH